MEQLELLLYNLKQYQELVLLLQQQIKAQDLLMPMEPM
jgi:hypothetical protein